MTKTVDQWAAEQCGVKVTRFDPENDQLEQYWEHKGKTYDGKWTIDFADCREIVREHCRIYTYPTKYSKDIGNDGIWSAYQDGGGHIAREKTISKAEIACITAIYEASQ